MTALPFFLLLLTMVPLSTLSSSVCKDLPFEIVTTLVPKQGIYDFGCDDDEEAYIAYKIAKTIDDVLVDTLAQEGVVKSTTFVCENGFYSNRRLLGHQRQLPRARDPGVNKFVFRGSGYCKLCTADNFDYRMLLEGKADPNRSSLDTSTHYSDETFRNDTMISEKLVKLIGTYFSRGDKEGSSSPSEDDNKKQRNLARTKKPTRKPTKRPTKKSTNNNNSHRNSNNKSKRFSLFGFVEEIVRQWNDPLSPIGTDLKRAHLATKLYLRHALGYSSRDLCTYKKLKDVVVEITGTEEFEEPDCD